MATFDIPEHWSAEQALEVYELLSDIQECIWNYYEIPMLELIRPELFGKPLEPPEPDEAFDDNIPF